MPQGIPAETGRGDIGRQAAIPGGLEALPEAEDLAVAMPGWRARSFGVLAALIVSWFALAFLGGFPISAVEWLALALLGAFAYSVGLVLASLVTLVMGRSTRP